MRKQSDKPWERREGESEKAFEAFVIYRDLGQDRTISAVVKRLEKSRSLIDRWKDRYNWSERALLYDNEIEKRALAKAVRERKSMSERHIKIAMQMQKKALEALQLLPVENMSSKDITNMMDIAAKLERLSRGEATEKTESVTEIAGELKVNRVDLSMLSDKELELLNELTDKVTST